MLPITIFRTYLTAVYFCLLSCCAGLYSQKRARRKGIPKAILITFLCLSVHSLLQLAFSLDGIVGAHTSNPGLKNASNESLSDSQKIALNQDESPLHLFELDSSSANHVDVKSAVNTPLNDKAAAAGSEDPKGQAGGDAAFDGKTTHSYSVLVSISGSSFVMGQLLLGALLLAKMEVFVLWITIESSVRGFQKHHPSLITKLRLTLLVAAALMILFCCWGWDFYCFRTQSRIYSPRKEEQAKDYFVEGELWVQSVVALTVPVIPFATLVALRNSHAFRVVPDPINDYLGEHIKVMKVVLGTCALSAVVRIAAATCIPELLSSAIDRAYAFSVVEGCVLLLLDCGSALMVFLHTGKPLLTPNTAVYRIILNCESDNSPTTDGDFGISGLYATPTAGEAAVFLPKLALQTNPPGLEEVIQNSPLSSLGKRVGYCVPTSALFHEKQARSFPCVNGARCFNPRCQQKGSTINSTTRESPKSAHTSLETAELSLEGPSKAAYQEGCSVLAHTPALCGSTPRQRQPPARQEQNRAPRAPAATSSLRLRDNGAVLPNGGAVTAHPTPSPDLAGMNTSMKMPNRTTTTVPRKEASLQSNGQPHAQMNLGTKAQLFSGEDTAHLFACNASASIVENAELPHFSGIESTLGFPPGSVERVVLAVCSDGQPQANSSTPLHSPTPQPLAPTVKERARNSTVRVEFLSIGNDHEVGHLTKNEPQYRKKKSNLFVNTCAKPLLQTQRFPISD